MYISYQDLEKEQSRDLDYKIGTFVAAVKSALAVCRHRPAIAFSGGKDSTVLWDAFRRFFPEWIPRLIIIYGNTGIEYPECVRFARFLAREWVSLVVECDGFEFHENKIQATKDKRRERLLRVAGYELIRFTGSEIVANPYEVCLETIEYMKSMARKRTGKAVNQ